MPKEEVEIKIARDVSASIKRSFQAATRMDSDTQVGLEYKWFKIDVFLWFIESQNNL